MVKRINQDKKGKNEAKQIEKKVKGETKKEPQQQEQKIEPKEPEQIQTTLEQYWRKGKTHIQKQRPKYEAPPIVFERGNYTPNADWWRINFCLDATN